MCEPVTIMTVASVALTAASTYSQVQSQKATAKNQKAQGEYSQSVAEYNARVTENEAQSVINSGVEAENAQRQETAQLLSRQRAQLGASNVDIGSGSALQLQQNTETMGEADALRIRSNYTDQANALKQQAYLTGIDGDNALIAGNNSSNITNSAVTGTILSGLGSAASSVVSSGVADSWYSPNSAAANQGKSVTGMSSVPSF